MLASEIMTTDVATVGPDTSIAELVALLVARGISAVPVVSGGRLVGIVSEGDLLRRAELGTGRKRSRWLEIATPGDRLATEYVHEHGRKVADVMTPEVVTVQHDTPVNEVADLLERRGIKRVPVLRDGKLVGIVSRANLVQALALHGGAQPAGAAPADLPTDLEVRTAILEELGRHKWGGFPLDANVIVRGGTVHAFGVLRSEAERRAMLVAIENTPGVAEVEDHLTYPPLRPPF